jgi:hypothetical protein
VEEHVAVAADAVPGDVRFPAGDDRVVDGDAALLALTAAFADDADDLAARVEVVGVERGRLVGANAEIAEQPVLEALVVVELVVLLDERGDGVVLLGVEPLPAPIDVISEP